MVYDTLLRSDPPQTGAKAEAMLSLTQNASVVAIRLLRLANGAGIELFEARKPDPALPIGLGDFGIHHFVIYCEAISAGAISLSGPYALHGPEGAAETA